MTHIRARDELRKAAIDIIDVCRFHPVYPIDSIYSINIILSLQQSLHHIQLIQTKLEALDL